MLCFLSQSLQIFIDFIQQTKIFTFDMHETTKAFFEQGPTIPTSPGVLDHKALTAIIVHSVIVISCKANAPLLLPLFNMICFPNSLTVSPTL